MLYVSTVRPDPALMGPFLACLWQGDVPSGFSLQRWLYLEGEPRAILLVWEGDDEAAAWVASAFGEFCEVDTVRADDATGGLQAALDRDLDGFGAWLRARGSSEAQIAHALDVRRRGAEAVTREEAYAEGVSWMDLPTPQA